MESFIHHSISHWLHGSDWVGDGSGGCEDRHRSLDRGPASRQDTSNESLAGYRDSQLGEETLVQQREMGT